MQHSMARVDLNKHVLCISSIKSSFMQLFVSNMDHSQVFFFTCIFTAIKSDCRSFSNGFTTTNRVSVKLHNLKQIERKKYLNSQT